MPIKFKSKKGPIKLKRKTVTPKPNLKKKKKINSAEINKQLKLDRAKRKKRTMVA